MFKLLITITLFLVPRGVHERSQRHLDVVPQFARVNVLAAGGEDDYVVAQYGVKAAVLGTSRI